MPMRRRKARVRAQLTAATTLHIPAGNALVAGALSLALWAGIIWLLGALAR